jgi:UDP-glucuronate 4-epimerase
MASAQRVMVTGAAGFIGSHVAIELASRGCSVVAVDCFLDDSYSSDLKRSRFSDLAAHSNIELIEQDLRERSLSKLPDEIDAIINEAAMPGLMKSWNDFNLYASCNLLAVDNLMQYSLKSGISKFVQISTSSVYGRDAIGNEQQETRPTSPYGVSKLAAEKLVLAYLENFDVPSTILRYFSVYGPGQRPDMAYHKFITAGLRGEVIYVYGDGLQSRTNTFVSDCVQGTVDALEMGGIGEIYNISGLHKLTVIEALTVIQNHLDTELRIEYSDARPGDQRETQGCIAKAARDFGYSPKTAPIDGLAAQVEWHKQFTVTTKL